MANDDDEFFEPLAFEKSYTEISSLKARFPEEIVAILAREVLASLAEHRSAFGATRAPVADTTIETVASALIDPDQNAAQRLISNLRAEGLHSEQLYLLYLAGAARKLGEWWNEDRITFAQVTTGSGRIYAILRSLKPFAHARRSFGQGRNAIFALTPGDDHALGVKMAADLMRSDGWEIDLVLDMDHDALMEHIAGSQPELIGLSGAGEHSVPNLAKLVLAIRVWSPRTLILVSGNVVDTSRETVALMGADAMTANMDHAREELERLWGIIARRT